MRVAELSSPDDAPTRLKVAESILENGASTAAELADRLGLTAAAVRRHLDHLTDAGLVDSRDERVVGARRRGRPAKVFVLTPAGRDQFESSYDDLASDALRFLRNSGGDEAVAAFARHRLAPLREQLVDQLEGVAEAERATVLAETLRSAGFAAAVSSSPIGEQVCQHHCPVAHVAGEFPQLCEAETELFAEVLGTHVQRLATIALGDTVCTTNLPHPAHATERVTS